MIEVKKTYIKTGNRNNEKPVIKTWKGEAFVRNHSFTATVLEIVKFSKNSDLTKINLVGTPGTGKTTLAMAIGHLWHKIALKKFDIPFVVKMFDKDNLLQLEDTLSKLEPVNHILIFDDVSNLGADATRQQIEAVKRTETVIRHLPGGKDVKIGLIKNFHYTLGLDKQLRQNDFSYYTTVGSSEMENMQKIVGTRYTSLLTLFQKLTKEAKIKEHFSYPLGKKGKYFIYKYRNPFIPLLFHDGDSLRFVVSPTREWMDQICTICSHSKDTTMKGYASTDDFVKDLDYKFNKGVARNAVRIKLHQLGMNVYPKRVRQCLDYIEKRFENKLFNLTEMMEIYNFDSERTRLDKKTPEEETLSNTIS